MTAHKAPSLGRRKPRQARSRATVEAILEAAARVFVADGIDRATTNQIADVAGVSVGSLYQYFDSKEAIAAELFERSVDAIMSIMSEQLPRFIDAPLEVAIREMVEALLASCRTNPKLQRALSAHAERIGSYEQLYAANLRAEEMLRAYLEARACDGQGRPLDLDVAAFVIVQAVDGIMLAATLRRPELLDDDRLVDATTELVRRYVAAP